MCCSPSIAAARDWTHSKRHSGTSRSSIPSANACCTSSTSRPRCRGDLDNGVIFLARLTACEFHYETPFMGSHFEGDNAVCSTVVDSRSSWLISDRFPPLFHSSPIIVCFKTAVARLEFLVGCVRFLGDIQRAFCAIECAAHCYSLSACRLFVVLLSSLLPLFFCRVLRVACCVLLCALCDLFLFFFFVASFLLCC